MFYGYLADLVMLLHGCFVLFVLLGGFFVLWKSFVAWVHVPAAIWAAGIELLGGVCPLTPLENKLRSMGGGAGYATGFVEHYLGPILYPEALTRRIEIGLGLMVLGLNIAVYLVVWENRLRAGKFKGKS